jgi:hypothetical protein
MCISNDWPGCHVLVSKAEAVSVSGQSQMQKQVNFGKMLPNSTVSIGNGNF